MLQIVEKMGRQPALKAAVVLGHVAVVGQVEGFRNHIAIDGSLEGVSGRDAARDRAVVQFDSARKKSRGTWYDAGGVASAVNDQQSKALGWHYDICRLNGLVHHPY